MKNSKIENLAEYVRCDSMYKFLEKLPPVIIKAYPACWKRFQGYPQSIRVDSYVVGLNNEINAVLHELGKEFPKLKTRLPKNKGGAYTHTQITSEGIKLTASRVGYGSPSPRNAEFRKDIAASAMDYLFDEPKLEFEDIAYMQVLHGWGDKKFSLKPSFLKLRYVIGERASLTLDLFELVGIDSKTLIKTISQEVILEEDNFQFREINTIGKVENI